MSGDASSIFVALFRQVHQQLRDELGGLNDDDLNWVPTPRANSIATIVVHLVGSEAETLQSVAGIRCVRDRESEFLASSLTLGDVLLLLDTADELIAQLEPGLDGSRLTAKMPLPTLSVDDLRSGLSWLIGNYGHAREHVGQIELTKQLLQR